MSEPEDVGKDVWKRWILEAIRKIRSQKQRPSVERICHAIRQHHNYHEDVVSERLERAVREGAVLKVYNKGQSSYKDPGGLQSRTLRIALDIDVSRAVAKAVRELGERDGSDLKTIEKHLQQAYQVTVDPEVDVRTVLKAAAKRAVTRGLITHHQGFYKAAERPRAGSHERTPKQKKNQESEKSPEGLPICAECLGTESRNSSGDPEPLISCQQCKSYAHPTCLNLLDHTTQTTLKALRWSCGECAWCSVCGSAGGWAARCSSCSGSAPRYAHAHCAPPPWRCATCKEMPATPKRSGAAGTGTPRGKKARTPRRPASDSEPSDGNDPPAPLDQRMSKEKQKFFRFSAFNLLKRRRDSSSDWEGWDRARFNGVRVTRVQRLELRLERRRRRRASPSSGSSSPEPEPGSPAHTPTIFERLAGDCCGAAWGFAAEAQKQRQIEQKPVESKRRSESPRKQKLEPRRIARRRSRCGERLLTTLFDGLSEFYSVRSESRSQSRHRGRPRREKSVRRESLTETRETERQVLKETRSTFRKHLETLKRERSPSPSPSPECIIPKEECNSSLSASTLVRLAASKRDSPDDSEKLFRALAQDRAPASNQTETKKLPPGVTAGDASLFSAALAAVGASEPEPVLSAAAPPPRCPSAIEFGQWEIDTWYSSPFPQEYARLPKLFLCEFCLKYAKSRAVLMRHLDKCLWRHPPATEIYRCGDISVFEVDGNANKIYCQNLCLLAKLFLDHKTLYYDVEPFLFYVLTKNDNKGCHLVGYFSKEKHCQQKYNVSCIMTMPQYQRQGYGRFLIHFSYLLSKEEGQPGTPEKPLSDLGRVSYHAYWKSVILEFLHDHKDKPFTLEDIAHTTGMHMNDIAATFQLLGFVRYLPNNDSMKLGLCIDWNKVDSHVKKLRSRPRLEIDPECLRWTPLLAPTVNPFRSPDEGSVDQDTENEEEMKTESEDTATEPETPVAKAETKSKTKVEKERTPEPVEVTSSGRRRTRPLKYSETTYQTTPTLVQEGGRKRKRDVNRKLSESNLTEDDRKPEETTPRQQRSKSVARRSSRVAQNELNEDSNPAPTPRSRRQSVKEKETYVSEDSQDSQEDTLDSSITATASVKAKAKRKHPWRGRPKKRQKVTKANKVRTDSPDAKKAKMDEETNCKTDDDSMEEEKPKSPVQNHNSPKSQDNDKPKEKSKNSDSSEDSSGEADDEMDVEEVEDRRSVSSKPASPRQVEENSTDHHTSDMELDSIHMDSPKSIAEKEQVIKETSTEDSEENVKPSENNVESPAVNTTESKPESQQKKSDEQAEVKNGEIKSPNKPSIEDKDTIIISESDDNNSQSCPLPSPKPNNTVPAQTNNENKPKEVEENESPSKVIPVVSTENAHIVLDHKIQEEVNPSRPPVDLIVPKIHQIETIVVEGESDNGPSPHVTTPPKLNDKSVINESPKPKRTPEKVNSECEQRKCEIRKETVIQHQAMDELKSPEKKSPTKPDSIIQNVDLQRDISNMKLPEMPKLDSYTDLQDRNKSQNCVSKESEIPFRNDMVNPRKDEMVITRNVIEPNMINYQNTVSNSMTIQQINTAQHSYLNHRASVSKESQAVQTDKVMKTSEANRVNSLADSPVISKPTKLEVPHPITSPVINPVIPKVPNVTDINFLPRCQSANAAVNLGSEMDPSFANSNAIQNSLGGSMNIVQCSSQEKDLKPREKSKLRDVRVNSAHSKLEKPEKKSKNDTPRSTPEPKVVFFPEQNANARKPETSVPINVINTNAGPVTSKPETKPANEAPKKQDFFKKEKTNTAKCDSKNNTVKHDKTCTPQIALKPDQNDLNKMLPKLRYDNDLVPKDYPMNQIPNYHTSHAQYQWPPWDPARLAQGTWDHNRFLDMKNSDKNYLDKFQGFNLPHLEQMQKSPQKLHPKYDQKDFHNIAYGAISSGIYATTGLPHFKETKAPTSKASECSQKNDCKPSKQSKTTTACQTQCEPKKSQAQNEAQMKQMMQRQVKQQEAVTSCAEYRQQSPQVLTSPGCKTPFNNGPCSQEKEIEKKSRQKKEESPKESKEEMCEAVSPALQSMGVYTPDSTSNSVHSVQYPSCELDVSQLGLESPSSIGSDLASPCYMHATPSPQYPHSAIHIPSIMTQPNQPPKQQKINNRNRNTGASSGAGAGATAGAGAGAASAKAEPMRGAATPPARHRTTPPHQPHAGGGAAAGGAGYQGGYLSFQQQQQYHGGGWAPSCSLAKLQQMAEAPQHHHQQYAQQAGGTQHYHKYYPAPNQLDAARTRTHSAPAPIPGNLSPMQHMQMAPTSRMSPNLNSHIISQYGVGVGLANSYRMPPQQQFNNLQMMNVNTPVQYSAQDPRAQQPNVYAYGYINAPPALGLQSLNSTMRR
ncbi:histone acetyltransferase KAT6B isoform X2 [Leguminivora glycinivorella]|uniref:histone acetyltransferase KAT6B isoform X2 n=1 Tax=Leguminivora glycinivorella TaxID=1035111 RepID=UPI00200EE1CD|nr:histone acetyltransferase KAT6B isoform X2 [Leguminivora glycinivorella]